MPLLNSQLLWTVNILYCLLQESEGTLKKTKLGKPKSFLQ
jgi:hypothetical protein